MLKNTRCQRRLPENFWLTSLTLLVKHLKKGNKVRVTGLGIFQVKKRPARLGRNPLTGEQIKIKASKKLAFRAAKEVKESNLGFYCFDYSAAPQFAGPFLFVRLLNSSHRPADCERPCASAMEAQRIPFFPRKFP